MRSSTSSSSATLRRGGEWRRHAGYAGVAILTLGLLVGLAAAIWSRPPWNRRRMDVASSPAPISRYAYLAHDARSGHVDHHVLFQGLGEVGDRLRAADVLFAGNSRLMFALPQPQVRPFFRQRALEYYVMGFGHTEGNLLAEAIIDRLDLHPRVVVVNADGSFFTDDASEWGRIVMASSRFDAVKYRAEAEATHWARRYLHRIVPHLLELYRNEREFIVYRSALDGTWQIVWQRMVDYGSPIPEAPGAAEPLDERTVTIARAFQAAVAARGGRLVFCSVPSPRTVPGHGQALAERLGVPFLAPAVDDMRHFDGSHLIPSSARRYAEALLQELDPLLAPNASVRFGRDRPDDPNASRSTP